jgi:hypothetical protein
MARVTDRVVGIGGAFLRTLKIPACGSTNAGPVADRALPPLPNGLPCEVLGAPSYSSKTVWLSFEPSPSVFAPTRKIFAVSCASPAVVMLTEGKRWETLVIPIQRYAMPIFTLRSLCMPVAALLLACGALAQETPPTIFVTSWQCDRTAMDDIIDLTHQVMPIYQELVNEGVIWSYAVAVHHWGDEWNYVTITLAGDMAAGIRAGDEFDRRAQERFGEDETFIANCPTHRDNIYVGAYTSSQPGEPEREPPFAIAMSYFNCPLNSIGDIVRAERETLLPAARASIDAGTGYWHGAMRHSWADEWTYVHVRAAEDAASVIAFAQDTARRAAENGGDDGAPTDVCPAHKDNIYVVVAATRAPTE